MGRVFDGVSGECETGVAGIEMRGSAAITVFHGGAEAVRKEARRQQSQSRLNKVQVKVIIGMSASY